MVFDEVIRDAARAICKARYGHLRGFDGREHAYEKEARAAVPILMEYGRAIERAAIVEWLRRMVKCYNANDDGWSSLYRIAQGYREAIEAIEAGKHLKGNQQ